MNPSEHMTSNELMIEIEIILDETKTGILATVDSDGYPHMRWMTPALLKDKSRVLFAVTCPGFGKVNQLKSNEKVQWIFQDRLLSKIITVNGRVNILENLSIRSEVLEVIGARLTAFWKYNRDERDLIVLETVITEGHYFVPLKGYRETVLFKSG